MADFGFGRGSGGGVGGLAFKAVGTSFPVDTAAGATIATLNNPYPGNTTYSVVGSTPGQLALSGNKIVKGNSTATAGSNYSIKLRAVIAGGTRAIEETFVFTAVAATSPVTPGLLNFSQTRYSGLVVAIAA